MGKSTEIGVDWTDLRSQLLLTYFNHHRVVCVDHWIFARVTQFALNRELIQIKV